MTLIEINNLQPRTIDEQRMRRMVHLVLQDAGIRKGEISVAVVEDAAIRELNRRHLEHDYATDVLSFLLDRDEHSLDGEIIVSAETADRQSARFGWSMNDELLLYVLHGTLHLVGFDDASDDDRRKMRAAEVDYLGRLDENLAQQHAQHAARPGISPQRA